MSADERLTRTKWPGVGAAPEAETPLAGDIIERLRAASGLLSAAKAESDEGFAWRLVDQARRDIDWAVAEISREEAFRERAEEVVKAFTAWSEDHNDGTYAYWKSDDLMVACMNLRRALAAGVGAAPEAETPPTYECAHGHRWAMLSDDEARSCPRCNTITFRALAVVPGEQPRRCARCDTPITSGRAGAVCDRCCE